MTTENEMFRLASELMRRFVRRARRGLGITIIVHDAELTPGAIHAASATTLPSRKHVRVLLSEILFRTVMADSPDIAVEDAGQVAARDLAEFELGKDS